MQAIHAITLAGAFKIPELEQHVVGADESIAITSTIARSQS